MRVHIDWERFLEQHPDLAVKWSEICCAPGPTISEAINEFFNSLVGDLKRKHWEPAWEYGPLRWRIVGERFNLIVDHEIGNILASPILVEMEVLDVMEDDT